VLFSLVTLCRISAADPLGPVPPTARASRPIVTIEVKAGPEIVSRVRSTVVPLLERLGVTAVVTAHPSRSDGVVRPLARAYIDFGNPRMPVLLVVDGATKQELSRRTLPETTSLETSIEGITVVLYVVVGSLLPQGPEAAAPESEATDRAAAAPDPERSSPRDRAADPETEPLTRPAGLEEAPSASDGSGSEAVNGTLPVWLAAGAFLRMLLLAESRPMAGAAISAELRGGSGLGVALLAAAHAPTEFSFEAAEFDLALYSVRLTPRVPLWTLPRIAAALEPGVGVDWFRTRLKRAPPDSSGASSTSSLDYLVSAGIGVRLQLTRDLELNSTTGVDLAVSPRRFVVHTDEQQAAALEPFRVRPWLLFGLAFSPSESSRRRGNAALPSARQGTP
jgi:hypothetical protein